MWESCSVLVPGIWSQWQNWGQAGLEEVHNPNLEVVQRFSQPWPWPALISQGSRGCTEAEDGPDLVGPAGGHGQPLQAQGELEDALC